MDQKNLYFETLHSAYGQYFEIEEMLYEKQTQQWHLSIFKNPRFGRVMALNGAIQTTEKDEFVYHEMLTHVPLFAHGEAKSVLIIGGGDGGILREVIRHQNVTNVTMVEIDNTVIEMCKTYFPHHSDGAFEDPRVKLVIADGMEFITNNKEKFDVIISDCTDPVGPGEVLFSSEFYKACIGSLAQKGIFVAQNGVPYMQIEEVQDTVRRMSPYVKVCDFYMAAVPTYIGGNMALAFATQDQKAGCVPFEILQERFISAGFSTRYYTPEVHTAAFALPAYIQQAINTSMDTSE